MIDFEHIGDDMTRTELRDNMRIIWDAPIAMDDGVVLRADVFLPAAEGRYPVVMTHGPYAKGLAFQEGYPTVWQHMTEEHPDVPANSSNLYQTWECVDPEKWTPDGYACVRVDSRGAGRSPGFLDVWSPRETKDYYDCIEWAGTQPWSSGKVGLCGISYYAANQWQVATLQPPHLTAMIPWEGLADFYRDGTHHGGIFNSFWAQWFQNQLINVQHGLGERGPRSAAHGDLVCGPETLSEAELVANRLDPSVSMRGPLLTEAHRARTPDWSKVVTPFLSAASWAGQGLHPRGNYEAFTNAASTEKWLEVHGLEHWTHFMTDYGRLLQKKFFDYFLKGEQNGWDQQPRVILNVRRPGEHFTWRDEHEWPLARTDWKTFYLDAAEKTLLPAPAAAASVTYEATGDGVTFWLPRQMQEVELCGPMMAKLFVASETVDADLFLVVRVFYPDGKEVVFKGTTDPHTPFAQGWLRVSHRKLDVEKSLPYRPYHTHDEIQPLTPGEIYEVDVEIWPTGLIVPEGYRIGLTVRGKDYKWPDGPGARLSNFSYELDGCGPFVHRDETDRPMDVFGGKVTVYTGADHPSYVLLPVIPSA